eukprot:scaffold36304_cov121-Isochrysis_galbana.AAC.12
MPGRGGKGVGGQSSHCGSTLTSGGSVVAGASPEASESASHAGRGPAARLRVVAAHVVLRQG